MMNHFRRIAITAILLTVTLIAGATEFKPESLHYKVLYKWGLINKVAGRATVSLRPTDGGFRATLTARTEPWADRIYYLRDTLVTIMQAPSMAPRRYERIAHEDGNFAHDIVEFIHSGNMVTGNSTRYRKRRKDTEMTTATTTLSATGTTVDMLSAFYYLRSLDFLKMKQGEKHSINIFSGKKKETLTITYSGLQQIEVAGTKQATFLVTFTFTTDGKTSSDPVKVWLSADNRKIPLRLEGQLKIGKIIIEHTSG
ncbi:MAG: DUF3108 domain-containing protein [Muribaculaceae bacterium]|nr:DUF3108 domain-containing protein [Muribaculaceae bacterium]